MAFTRRKSLWGRQLALSSSGYLIGSTEGSTDFTIGYMSRDSTGTILGPHDEPVVTTTSTAASPTLTFGGVINIASSATAQTFLLTAPRAGQGCEIYITSSASALTFGGTSTGLVFSKIGAGTAGSTTLTLTDANLAGQSLILRGITATKIGVVNGSTVIQA